MCRCLLRIRTEDEAAKTLVFSTWPDVLDILASALDENSIPYAALHRNTSTTQNKFKRNIQKFKVETCLYILGSSYSLFMSMINDTPHY